jgi:hypothetical protein
MPSFVDEDVASGLIEASPKKGAPVPIPDWFTTPTCRCEKPMELSLIAQRPDGTQIRTFRCAVCDHQLRLTIWAN